MSAWWAQRIMSEMFRPSCFAYFFVHQVVNLWVFRAWSVCASVRLCRSWPRRCLFTVESVRDAFPASAETRWPSHNLIRHKYTLASCCWWRSWVGGWVGGSGGSWCTLASSVDVETSAAANDKSCLHVNEVCGMGQRYAELFFEICFSCLVRFWLHCSRLAWVYIHGWHYTWKMPKFLEFFSPFKGSSTLRVRSQQPSLLNLNLF